MVGQFRQGGQRSQGPSDRMDHSPRSEKCYGRQGTQRPSYRIDIRPYDSTNIVNRVNPTFYLNIATRHVTNGKYGVTLQVLSCDICNNTILIISSRLYL